MTGSRTRLDESLSAIELKKSLTGESSTSIDISQITVNQHGEIVPTNTTSNASDKPESAQSRRNNGKI